MGVAALAALAAVLWIATALTPLPAVAAVGVTAVTGACAVGFGYLRREVAKADTVDRQTVADIDAELIGARGFVVTLCCHDVPPESSPQLRKPKAQSQRCPLRAGSH